MEKKNRRLEKKVAYWIIITGEIIYYWLVKEYNTQLRLVLEMWL